MPLPARNCAWIRFSRAALIRGLPSAGMDALADH
jgi:hypothetical protein